ncbi:glutamate racemase [Arcobacter sp. FWKO B]|uniref:glutamate racemase n=1 Tax=Arcobacter sp. FWKO B TaxID=2593672 RepID=UPI0018A514FE|nr:glutamate racemase [Arcobacter sp. FWKO B]QOG11938.1 glutamate racemase [Arcobacter sp. FWKO B]
MRVGVFDSGVGGLTVVKSLLEHKLFKEIIYYGDTARVPYGVKDKNTIIRYAVEALEFFKNFEIDIFVIACNTVSAYALDRLVQEADIPVVGVINPGVIALKNSFIKKDINILVIGTKATIRSGSYETQLKSDGYTNIISIQTGLFVPIVEEGIFDGEVLDSTMRYYFKDINNIDAIILGCTHFPLIEKKISEYFGGAKCIHSGDAIVEYLQKNYNCDKNFDKTSVQFFASDNPDGLKSVAKEWLGDLLHE